MNEIIKVNEDAMTVSARDLHESLGVASRFSRWFADNSEMFIEGADYNKCTSSTVVGNGAIRELEDYAISILMAKHIALMSRTEKGKEIRNYLIDLERAWNTPEQVMARALKIADKTIASLKAENNELALQNAVNTQRINELQPKADYTDEILKSSGTMTITQIAKDYGMGPKEMHKLLKNLDIQYKQSGQWLLYSKYQSSGYTKSETVPIIRRDGRNDFAINTKWTQKGRLFLYKILKENGVLPIIERGNEDGEE